ncbi:hypothetical protein GCM10011607_28500 [Shewanella inventionis]|uniref:Uncharacterized protein n=1 Tax=Shewanella inventionis TaxID=1738770 RepID=A0ABQ1JH26_9GAMM|nr:hypothetical protein [Shewanella inventionis]GGB66120.1 hypothetical protein GCM10011607_28500 [Shewanella inventionis]
MLPNDLVSLIKDELALRNMPDIEFKAMVDLMGSDDAPNDQIKITAITKKIKELEGNKDDSR